MPNLEPSDVKAALGADIIDPEISDHAWRDWPARILHLKQQDYESHPCCMIAVDMASKKIIADSSGYVCWWLKRPSIDRVVETSMSGLAADMNIIYEEIIKIQPPPEIFYEPVFLLSNAYTGWNFGHDLSSLLFSLKTYNDYCRINQSVKPPKVLLSKDRIRLSKNSADIISQFVPRKLWFELESNKVYEFRNLIIPANRNFDLHSDAGYDLCMNFLQVYRKNLTSKKSFLVPQMFTRYLSKRFEFQQNQTLHKHDVVLCKLEHHKYARRAGIMPAYIVNNLKSNKGWTIIDPESTSFVNIIEILGAAKRVILGDGAIQYAHRHFINSNAKVYILFDKHNYYSPLDGIQDIHRLNIEDNRCMDHIAWEPLFDAIDCNK